MKKDYARRSLAMLTNDVLNNNFLNKIEKKDKKLVSFEKKLISSKLHEEIVS